MADAARDGNGPNPPALAAVLLLVAGLISACGSEPSGRADRPLTVVATTPVAEDLVRRVAGGRVEVRGLLEAGADPHGYEPRPSDAQAIADAALVVRSGGEIDSWLDGLVEGASGGARELTLLEAAARDRARGPEPDSHWWLDPRAAARALEAIAGALAAVDPNRARAYRRSARDHIRELQALDRGIERCIAGCPLNGGRW